MYERESRAYKFLNMNEIDNVPKFISGTENKNAICYEWIEGENPLQNSETLKEVFSTLDNLKELYMIDNSFDMAIDAVLDGKMMISQLNQRISKLKNNSNSPHDYIYELEKRFEFILNSNLSDKVFLDRGYSFSDIGVHNIIVDSSRKFYFIDLEFFGLDSFAKFCGDLYVHPKTLFSSNDIYREIRSLKVSQPAFEEDLLCIIPSIALKWSTIAARREFLEPKMSNENANVGLFIDYFDFLLAQKSLSGVLTVQEFQKMR
jgi:hypothetical protein